jgi:hypothetical protein
LPFHSYARVHVCSPLGWDQHTDKKETKVPNRYLQPLHRPRSPDGRGLAAVILWVVLEVLVVLHRPDHIYS